MKRKDYFIFGIVLLNTLAIIWLIVSEKNLENVSYRYILNQKVFEEFAATKEKMNKLNKVEQKQKALLDSLNMQLIALENSKSINADLLKTKRTNYQNLYNEFSLSNQKEIELYRTEIWNQINQYISEYGKSKGYTIIFGGNGTGTLMYGDSDLNVTDELITYINQKYAGN